MTVYQERHHPYHESDHVLAMSYNLLTDGQANEDLERLRPYVTFLDAVGARRLPDPTTAGDFLRRFQAEDVAVVQEYARSERM